MKTSLNQVADYWLTERATENVALPGDEALEYCWRCRCRRPLQRCHIIPASLGGADAPYNLVLLCASCHKEAPNHTNPEYMPIWIKATRADFPGYYWTLRALEMFEIMFGRSIGEGLKLKKPEGIKERMREMLEEQTNNMIVHYGEASANESTMACVLAEIEHSIIQEYGDQQGTSADS